MLAAAQGRRGEVPGVDAWAYVLYIAVLFVANALQAITGFAGTALAMPAVALLVGADTARVVLNVVMLVSSAWIAWTSREHLNRPAFCRIVVFMLVGMAAGMALYRFVPSDALLRVYGAAIVVIALWGLVRGIATEGELSRAAQAAILFVAGVIQGAFVSGGALLVLFAVRVLPSKEEFRATLAPVWVVLGVIMCAEQAWEGAYTPQALGLLALAIVPVAVAVVVGSRLQRRISQAHFTTLTFALLAVSGLVAML